MKCIRQLYTINRVFIFLYLLEVYICTSTKWHNKLFTYSLIIFLISISVFIFSLERMRVNFRQFWNPLFKAIFIQFIVMVVWDHFFVILDVWVYSKEYRIGKEFWELPIENYFYYILIPYFYFFIYECLNKYVKDYLRRSALYISLMLIIFLLLILWFNYEKLYTATAAVLAIYILINHILVFRSHQRYLGRLYVTYLVTLIPFMILNGMLISLPMIHYNFQTITLYFIRGIPFENFIHHFIMLMIVITIYENIKKKKGISIYQEEKEPEDIASM